MCFVSLPQHATRLLRPGRPTQQMPYLKNQSKKSNNTYTPLPELLCGHPMPDPYPIIHKHACMQPFHHLIITSQSTAPCKVS